MPGFIVLDRAAAKLLRDEFKWLGSECDDRLRLNYLQNCLVNWPAQFSQFRISCAPLVSASLEDQI
jgi:hypothetical protein